MARASAPAVMSSPGLTEWLEVLARAEPCSEKTIASPAAMLVA
jgi:hypothetical protein